jgi:hypothetical protein
MEETARARRRAIEDLVTERLMRYRIAAQIRVPDHPFARGNALAGIFSSAWVLSAEGEKLLCVIRILV